MPLGLRATAGLGSKFGLVLSLAGVLLACRALGFGAGLAPFAPGTFGTLAAVPLFFLTASWPLPLRLGFIALFILLSFWIAHVAGKFYGESDDQHIVIDEVAGYLVTTCLAAWSWQSALIGFVFFRLFDITKPWPARYFDRRVKNGFGNVMDDVVAGGFALACTTLVLRYTGL